MEGNSQTLQLGQRLKLSLNFLPNDEKACWGLGFLGIQSLLIHSVILLIHSAIHFHKTIKGMGWYSHKLASKLRA